jgi:protein-disulfide isomerase
MPQAGRRSSRSSGKRSADEDAEAVLNPGYDVVDAPPWRKPALMRFGSSQVRLLVAAAMAWAIPATGVPAAAAAPAKAAAQRDWTKVVAVTPEGGFRMGNPAAPVKLVEYASYTCPHCAHFVEQGVPKLIARYVRSGRISFELRNFVRDPYDLSAALLSRCAGPRNFFPLMHTIFATQDQWTGRFAALSASEYDALNALPPTPKLIRIAAIGGLDTMAAKFGVPAARAKTCLSDEKAAERFAEMRRVATSQYDLQGTPTFLINGKKAENVYDWTTLEPLLGRGGG